MLKENHARCGSHGNDERKFDDWTIMSDNQVLWMHKEQDMGYPHEMYCIKFEM